MQDRHYYVYILTNKNHTVLYTGLPVRCTQTGVTSNLKVRVYQHHHKLLKGFTKRYNVNKLVYAEVYDDIWDALNREKQIKARSRQKKLDLINRNNPDWNDLSDDLDYE